MKHVCQKCGAINEYIDLKEKEVSKSNWGLGTGTSNYFEPSEEAEANIEGKSEQIEAGSSKYRKTYWTCRVCGKDHTINLEKLEE